MSALAVTISAETADATAKLAVLKSAWQDQSATLKELASQAAATGTKFDDFSPALIKAAEAAAQSKAQIKALNQEMRTTHEEAGGFTDTLSDWRHALLGLTDPIRGVYSGMGEIGEIFAAGAALDGIKRFAEATLDAASTIQRQADAVGLASDSYQAFVQSAKQAGVEQESVSSAILRVNNAQGEAAAGIGLYAQAFKELNVSAGLPAEESIPALSRALLDLQDSAEQSRLMVLLFGRSGQELRPALEEWAQGTDTVKDKMSALGLIIDPKVTAAAEKADTDWQNMQTRFEADFTPAIVGVTDAFLSLTEAITDSDGAGRRAWQDQYAQIHAAMGELDAYTKLVQANLHLSPLPEPKMLSPQAPDIGNGSQIIDQIKQGEAAYKKAQEEATAAAKKGAEERRQLADVEASAANRLADSKIAGAQRANNFELTMGAESLDQWRATAKKEADDKLTAELAYLSAKAAADKGNIVEERRDLDQIALAHQEHTNALTAIDQQYAEKKRAQDQQELQDFLSADAAKLADGLKTLDAEFSQHKVTADQRFALEQQLTEKIYGEEIARLNALIATLTAGTKAYEDAIKQREKLEQDFTKQSGANTNQLETYEAQKWTQLGNSIKSSFNSAIDGMIFQGKSFEQGMLAIAEGVLKAFLSMGETIAENWIETQIAAMFETKTSQGVTALGQVSDAAAVAGANAYSAYAAYPPVAAAMSAAAVGATMSFSSLIALDVGAWDLKRDMVAQLHKGEMVVPQNFASGLRGNGGGFGGDTYHTNYSPSITARDPTTIRELVRNNHSEFVGEMRRLVRNGSLRA